MPGIEVLPSGQIMYQGNSINKVNIEGMDLMGDQYNQATQNMPGRSRIDHSGDGEQSARHRALEERCITIALR